MELSYDTHNALLNLNTIGLAIFIYHLKLLILPLILRPCSNKYPRFKKYYDSWVYSMLFTEILVLLLVGYFELLISGYLVWFMPLMTTNGEVFSTIIGIWSLILALMVLPVSLIWMLM